MRILLLNDNPVARKLVALSAQYTKNNLTIIGSVAEIEQSDYDVVIVDDAYYSDEMMTALVQKVTYKVSILMLARGNNLSEGFEKVLHKPFLPADLIEVLTVIEETLPTPPLVIEEAPMIIPLNDPLPPLKEERSSFSEPELMISFDEPLPPLKEESSVSTFDPAPLQEETEEAFMSFEKFSMPQDNVTKPSIPEREVLEDSFKKADTQGLDFSIGSFDLPSVATQDEEPLPPLEELPISPLLDEESYAHFDDMMMPESKAEKSFFDAPLFNDIESPFDTVDNDYLPVMKEKREIFESIPEAQEVYDDFVPMETTASTTHTEFLHPYEEEMKTTFYSDEVFDTHSKHLHPYEEEMKTAFYSDEMDVNDVFAAIPEREMKRAMGEPVEEVTVDIPVVMTQSNGNIPSEGMAALQVLLKALSNEETASSLKGLNISININLNLGNAK